MMVCPTQQQTRIMEWMENHLVDFKSVSLQDITSMYTILTLVGPKAKDLMTEMCETEIESFQPFTFRFFNMSYASGVMAVARTFLLESLLNNIIRDLPSLYVYKNGIGH